MKRDNIQYVNIVIEENGSEGDIEYNPILATTSDVKAKMKVRELYKARKFDRLSKSRWEEFKAKLEAFLANLDDSDWDNDNMYQSDAEMIYNYLDVDVPLDILVKAEEIYDEQDPYYEAKIYKLRLE